MDVNFIVFELIYVENYVVDYVADPNLNPLYLATGMEHVNMRLLQFPEKIINENQVIRLEHLSPFIRLSSKGKLLFEQEDKISDSSSSSSSSSCLAPPPPKKQRLESTRKSSSSRSKEESEASA